MNSIRPTKRFRNGVLASLVCAVGPSAVQGVEELAELPAVDPGADLLFSSNRSGDMEVYRLDASSVEPRNLTNSPGTDNWPVWSPDGEKIAFQSRRNGAFDIYVMDADGSNLVRLTDHPDHDYLPSWTPDGRQITFISWREEDEDRERQNHVYIMQADGGGQRRFLRESPGTSAALNWSPDGKRMIMSWRRGASTDLRLMDANGRHVAWLTGPDSASDASPAFSPDGLRVVFYSEENQVSRIEVISVDGRERRTVVGAGRNYYPRWSPDGCGLLWSFIVGVDSEDDIDIGAARISNPSGPLEFTLREPLITRQGRDAEASWRPRPGEHAVLCRSSLPERGTG